MIRTGDTVVNPVAGEQLAFLKTARDTDGEAVVVERVVQPDGFVASAHFHPYQAERFQVRAGRLGERLIETMYGLAADGKTNRRGMPSPLRLAVIAQAHFDDVRLPLVPVWMQRAGLALGAPLGRALGYRREYVPAGEAVPASA